MRSHPTNQGVPRGRLDRLQHGFSLVELVTTLAIIGILGAVAIPRMFDNRAFSERGYVDEIAFALRYAQKIAAASECDVLVSINAAGYVAFQRGQVGNTCDPTAGWTTAVRRPDGSPLSGTAPTDVAAAPDTDVVFAPDGAVVGAAPAPLVVGAFTLSITPATGMVTVVP